MPRAKTVVLSCLHMYDVYPLPRNGDTLWCTPCGKYSTYVEKPETGQRFTVRCNKCKRVNERTKAGGAMQAQIRAEKHARSFPDHEVTITDNLEGETLAVVIKEVSSPMFSDV